MSAIFYSMPKKYIKSFLLYVEDLVAKQKPVTETKENVFIPRNGTPQENVAKVIEMMG